MATLLSTTDARRYVTRRSREVEMASKTKGRCFCGEIRYQISGDPVIQLYCYCTDCLAITGTDGYAGYMVKNEDSSLVNEKPKTHDKIAKDGRTVGRHFCGTCGSNLWVQTEFRLISVAAGTLDEPSQFMPSRKAFAHDVPKWARIPDGL